MPDFDLADGYINLKANPEQFDQEMAAIDARIAENHEARLQMQSSAGQAALAKAHELRRETEKTAQFAQAIQNSLIYGERTALRINEQRLANERKRMQFVKESARFGESMARRLQTERSTREDDASMFGAGVAGMRARERSTAFQNRSNVEQNALRHGRAVADYIESKRQIKEDRRNQRLVDAFRYGRVGGAAVGAGRSFSQAMGGIAPAAAVGAAGGALGIGLIQNVPILANTLSESFGLLSTVISKDLIGPVLELSKLLQDTARWWDQLGAGTKSFIVETVKLGAILGSVALATTAATKAFGFMLAGLTTLTKHPLILALAGGAMIGAGAYDLGKAAFTGKGFGTDNAPNLSGRNEAFNTDPNRHFKGGNLLWAWLNRNKTEADSKDDRTKLGPIGPSSMGSLGDFYRKMLVDTTGGSEIEAERAKQLALIVENTARTANALENKPKVGK